MIPPGRALMLVYTSELYYAYPNQIPNRLKTRYVYINYRMNLPNVETNVETVIFKNIQAENNFWPYLKL